MSETGLLLFLRSFASWAAIVGTCVLAAYFFWFLIYHSLKKTTAEGSWFLTVIEQHFAATIGIPLSAISAACIVLMLEATSGPIEFEVVGFHFKGASGPVVLWVLGFLSFIFAMKLLWKGRE